MDKETQKEMKKNQELIDHYDYLKNANDVYQYQTPLVKPKS